MEAADASKQRGQQHVQEPWVNGHTENLGVGSTTQVLKMRKGLDCAKQ